MRPAAAPAAPPAGFVPRAFAAAFPRARVSRSSRWAGFPEPYASQLMLDPGDPLFAAVGAAYVSRLRAAFGPEPQGRRPLYIADRRAPPPAGAGVREGVWGVGARRRGGADGAGGPWGGVCALCIAAPPESRRARVDRGMRLRMLTHGRGR
jgi:hypothetical protein